MDVCGESEWCVPCRDSRVYYVLGRDRDLVRKNKEHYYAKIKKKKMSTTMLKKINKEHYYAKKK